MKKKIILLVIALLGFLTTYAQLNVSTNSREVYSWDKDANEWKFESEDTESVTLFEFNKEITLVKHTSETMTSDYIIESQEFDESDESNHYIFEVLNEEGNKSLMIFDIKNQNIRFVNQDGPQMVKYLISNTWEVEE